MKKVIITLVLSTSLLAGGIQPYVALQMGAGEQVQLDSPIMPIQQQHKHFRLVLHIE